jgi:hypothetical protein
MNLKVLSLVFLCLFSASIICNVSTIMLKAAESCTCRASTNSVHTAYITINGTEPAGDPIDGGGWPTLKI